MISAEAAIYLLASGASALVFVGLLAWLRRIDAGSRGVFWTVAGVMGVAAVTYPLTGFGIGTLTVGGGSVLVPLLVNDLVAYPAFFVIAGVLAGASRKHLVALGGVSVAQRLAFEAAGAGYVEGILVLVAAAAVVGGWFVHLYLFLGPVWAAAQDVPVGRRLVHWKCRNLLLFLIGMLIVFGVLILAGVFDFFVVSLTNAYISFLVRAGLAGFVFANASRITGGAAGEALPGGGAGTAGARSGD
jgi:hypothetical protein